MAAVRESSLLRPAARAGAAAAVAAASFLAGIVFAALGAGFGPAVSLAVPLVVLLAAAIFSRPWLGVAAVYASLPASFISLPTDAIGLQAAEVMVFLVVGLVALRRLVLGHAPLAWAPPLWWALLLVSWAVVATPSAVDSSIAVKQVAQLVGALLFTLTVVGAAGSLEDVRRMVRVLLVVGAGVALYGLRDVASVRARFGGAVIEGRAAGVFPQPNDLGAFAALLLFVSVGWMFGSRSRRGRAWGAVAVVSSATALALSLSRGAWIGTLGGALVLLVLLPAARRALLAVGLPLIIAGLALTTALEPESIPQVEVVRERISTFANPTNNPYDDRPSIYREALREIREDPLTGHGPGAFPLASARAGSVARTVGAIHAHNVLLTVAAEIGLPGAALLVALTIALAGTVLRTLRKLRDPHDLALVAGIAAALSTMLGQGIVDFNLRNPVLLLLAASLVGMVLVARREPLPSEEPA